MKQTPICVVHEAITYKTWGINHNIINNILNSPIYTTSIWSVLIINSLTCYNLRLSSDCNLGKDLR